MYDKFGSMNKVFLMGNAGKDPEVRFSASGMAILKVSLATSTRSGKGDQAKEETQWHNITAFGKTAEFAGEKIRKGSKLLVEGQIKYRSWDKDDGTKGYATEIVANRLEVVGGAKSDSGMGDSGFNRDKYDSGFPKGGSSAADDDIPF